MGPDSGTPDSLVQLSVPTGELVSVPTMVAGVTVSLPVGVTVGVPTGTDGTTVGTTVGTDGTMDGTAPMEDGVTDSTVADSVVTVLLDILASAVMEVIDTVDGLIVATAGVDTEVMDLSPVTT